jgi:hypothetical protein
LATTVIATFLQPEALSHRLLYFASLPDPAQFLRQLKAKAGLGAQHWSDSFQALRFTTESFGDHALR